MDHQQQHHTQELRFRVMGSNAHIMVVGGSTDLLGIAKSRIEQLEQRWSRFIQTSEVSELTSRAGHAVAVSDDTILLVERAVVAWRETGGSVDATVLDAVIRAGYDRSLELVRSAETSPATRQAPAPPHDRGPLVLPPGCTDIEVDRVARTVTLPAGTGFDPGGIGKGLAADIVAVELLDRGADGVCINLGGDLRVIGTSPQGGGWTVDIADPWTATPIALIGVNSGAVATSTTLLRSWTVDGERRHHLIDPTTGLPSDTDLTQVSVIAAEAWQAEVLAKAVLLRGTARAFDLIEPGVDVLAIDRAGNLHTTPGLSAYLGTAVLPSSISRPHYDRSDGHACE